MSNLVAVRRLFLVGVGVLTLAIDTATCFACPSAPVTVSVTDQHNGTRVTVPRGGTLELRLPTVPGTGFGWHIVRDDPGHLRLIESKNIQERGSSAPGATETYLLRFEAIARGEAVLELKYSRPWEREVAALKTYRLTIDVC
jgi:predicted secreted protein